MVSHLVPNSTKRKTTALFASLVWYVITEIGMSKKADNIKGCMGTCLFAYVHAIFLMESVLYFFLACRCVSDLPSVPKYILFIVIIRKRIHKECN